WGPSTTIRESGRASVSLSPTPRRGSRFPTTACRATARVATRRVDPKTAGQAASANATIRLSRLDSSHHLLAGAVQAAHHRALADAEGACRLLVGEAGDVDRDEHVAEIGRERGDRRVELAGLERGLRLERARVGDEVELLG